MVVQLRQLEKQLEQCMNDQNFEDFKLIIDEYVSENSQMTSSASSKLHELLYKIWSAFPPMQPSSGEDTETPLNGLNKATSELALSSINEEVLKFEDPKVAFLRALVRLAPCLINDTQLQIWWRELAPYAIDSTGQRIELVKLSQKFIEGVLTGSFNDLRDHEVGGSCAQISLKYGERLLKLYVSNDFTANGIVSIDKVSEERLRFIRVNCRMLFGEFARNHIKSAFTLINKLFVWRIYRLHLLELVVGFLSESQHSKLAEVYETPFFESLLQCLEYDTSRVVLQLAITSLSMLVVHIRDKLVSTGLLFRVYACFGRSCSWQASGNTHKEAADIAIISESRNHNVEDFLNRKSPESWEVLEGTETDETAITSVKVISLFTFLYGLFPLNTLVFCRQCDEYLKTHDYVKNFSDYWSRFMVIRKAESMVSRFQLDPALLMSTKETELSKSANRFQEVGDVLELTSVCTSRLIAGRANAAKSVDTNDTAADEVESQTEYMENNLKEHQNAFEMRPIDQASHWHRELLLIRSELAFSNFSLQMSEWRALRWQQRTSDRSILEIQNENLVKENQMLRSKVASLEEEAVKAVRSARNMMHERSAYEAKMLDRNREFREKIRELETHVLNLTVRMETANAEKEAANTKALEIQNEAVTANEELKVFKNESDSINKASNEVNGSRNEEIATTTRELEKKSNELAALQWSMKNLERDHESNIRKLQAEVSSAQAAFAKVQEEMASKVRAAATSSRRPIDNEEQDKAGIVHRLKHQNDELVRRCMTLEYELRARKVHEEERLNELQAALLSSKPYQSFDQPIENRFKGRGGAQGVPRGVIK